MGPGPHPGGHGLTCQSPHPAPGQLLLEVGGVPREQGIQPGPVPGAWPAFTTQLGLRVWMVVVTAGTLYALGSPPAPGPGRACGDVLGCSLSHLGGLCCPRPGSWAERWVSASSHCGERPGWGLPWKPQFLSEKVGGLPSPPLMAAPGASRGTAGVELSLISCWSDFVLAIGVGVMALSSLYERAEVTFLISVFYY